MGYIKNTTYFGDWLGEERPGIGQKIVPNNPIPELGNEVILTTEEIDWIGEERPWYGDKIYNIPPSPTPSISSTPIIPSVTPTMTPTISITPSITPTISLTPTPSNPITIKNYNVLVTGGLYNYFSGDYYLRQDISPGYILTAPFRYTCTTVDTLIWQRDTGDGFYITTTDPSATGKYNIWEEVGGYTSISCPLTNLINNANSTNNVIPYDIIGGYKYPRPGYYNVSATLKITITEI